MRDKIILLGVGNVALHVVKLLPRQCTIYGTTRLKDRLPVLRSAGITPILVDEAAPDPQLFEGADVLVSFPPDGSTDSAWATLCRDANAIVYISSTGVYGKTKGVINEDSPVDLEDPSARNRLLAESIWRQLNAIVLRCPGLYGPETGLHLRLRNGSLRISGHGEHYVSRIHLDDLAKLIVGCFDKGRASSTYVVGDHGPCAHVEVITWLCEKMGLPFPEQVSVGEVSPMLRGSRRVDPSRILADLQITLQYPSFKEGYTAILDAQL